MIVRPIPENREHGTLIIKLSAIMKVSVSIDGVLVAEDKTTNRLEISGVSAGERKIKVIGGAERGQLSHEELVSIQSGQKVVMLIKAPEYSSGGMIALAALSILAILSLGQLAEDVGSQ